MKKGKRGGARKNAGRKPPLDERGRIDVGAWCQEEWRKVAQATANQRFDSEKLLPARLKDRREALRKRAQLTRRPVPASEYIKAGQEVYGKRKRGYRLTVTRPYGGGAKAKIIAGAIAYTAKKYRVSITARWVVRVWNEFRTLERSLADSR